VRDASTSAPAARWDQEFGSAAIGRRVDAILGPPFGKGLALEREFLAEARIKIAE
jgi:hypothetical protein